MFKSNISKIILSLSVCFAACQNTPLSDENFRTIKKDFSTPASPCLFEYSLISKFMAVPRTCSKAQEALAREAFVTQGFAINGVLRLE